MASIIQTDSFTASALEQNSVEVSWTPRTKAIDFRGDRTFTSGTAQTINVILHRNKDRHTQDNTGKMLERDGYIMYNPDYNITKHDLITFGTEQWQVGKSVRRGPSGDVYFYGFADIFGLNEDIA